MKSSYLPHTRFSLTIDQVLAKSGRQLSWIWLVLMLIIVLNVVLRYGFNLGSIELEELQWHLYSSGFLIGLSYAYLDDKHIRVDILHERFSPNLKAWVELYGTLIFLIPFLILILLHCIFYTYFQTFGVCYISEHIVFIMFLRHALLNNVLKT